MTKISVLVTTLNEERNIRRCLESVKWANEIIIVDAFSTDRTVEIAKGYTGRIFQKNVSFSEGKKIAFEKTTGNWILSIDADEEITIPLREEILEATNKSKYDAFRIGRKTLVLGKWINPSLSHSPNVSLFRKSKSHFIDKKVHEHFETTGKIGTLKNYYLHYQNDSISSTLTKKTDRYTTLEVEERIERGDKFHILNLIYQPIRYFIWIYFLLGMARYGIRGLWIATYRAFYKFTEEMKMFEERENG